MDPAITFSMDPSVHIAESNVAASMPDRPAAMCLPDPAALAAQHVTAVDPLPPRPEFDELD